MKLSVHLILIINAILMTLAGLTSGLFGITGFTYFGIFAVPLTSIGCFLKFGVSIPKKTLLQILGASIIYVGISYIVSQVAVPRSNFEDYPLLEQVLWFAPKMNYSVLISSFFITLSTFVLVYFITEELPQYILEKIDSRVRFNGFYISTLLTMVSVFSIDCFIKWKIFGEEKIIIFPIIWLILFYITPYFYIKSYKIFFYFNPPSRKIKILFSVSLAILYLIFVIMNINEYELPHTGV